MSNKYHAGTEYTNEQRDQLDAIYHEWILADMTADYYGYDNEEKNDRANAMYTEYEALRAKFDADNAPIKRGVATGNQRGFTGVSTAQMVAAAASDDPEMVAEMGKVKSLAFPSQLAVRKLWMDFENIKWDLSTLLYEATLELERMAESAAAPELPSATSYRFGGVEYANEEPFMHSHPGNGYGL